MIVLTPGINSYVSLDTANEIASEHLFANIDDRFPAALATATRLLDRMHWRGKRTNEEQELQWPRVIFRPADPKVAADTIPPVIARATVELAFHLLTQGAMSQPSIQMRQLGDSMAMYFPTTPDDLPRHVRKLVAPFLNVESAHVAEMIP